MRVELDDDQIEYLSEVISEYLFNRQPCSALEKENIFSQHVETMGHQILKILKVK